MIWLLLLPIAGFLALLVGSLFGYGGLTLDRNVKLSDLPTLLAIIVVAIVVEYVFKNREKVTGSEKKLLTSHVAEILSDLAAVRKLVSQSVGKRLSSDEATILVQAFEACSDSLSSLESCLHESHCVDLVPTCQDVGDTFLLYKDAITGGDFPASPVLEGGIARSSMFRARLDKELRLLGIEIARS